MSIIGSDSASAIYIAHGLSPSGPALIDDRFGGFGSIWGESVRVDLGRSGSPGSEAKMRVAYFRAEKINVALENCNYLPLCAARFADNLQNLFRKLIYDWRKIHLLDFFIIENRFHEHSSSQIDID